MAAFVMDKTLTVLVIIFCFAGLYVAEGKGTLKGNNITFSPLKEGKNYTLKSSNGGWLLSGYDAVAERVVLSMKCSPPYEAIKELIRSLHDKAYRTAGDVIKQTLADNVPVAFLTSLSFISAFALPIIGIIFGCFRCKGRCGGDLIEENMVLNPMTQRQGFTAAILLCSLFIMTGAFSIAIFNDKMDSVLPVLDSTLLDAIDGITVYKENTLRELNEVAGENMNFTNSLITQEITNLPFAISKPIMNGGKGTVTALMEAMNDLGAAVNDLRDSLKAVVDVVDKLRANGKTLRDGLEDAQKSLTDAKSQCNSDPDSAAGGACDTIPTGEDTLQPDADFTKVPDAKQELSNVEGIVARSDFASDRAKVEDEFNLLPSRINDQTLAGREEITNFTQELQIVTEQMMNSLGKSSHMLQKDVLIPAKDEIHKIVGKRGIIDRYSGYRWLTLLFVSLAVTFTALLTLMGLVTGIIGSSSSDTPSTRSDAADCAGRILMCVVGLYFFSALFLDLLLAVAFFLGANATFLCEAAADLSLIVNTIDDPSTLGYYPISKVVLGNGQIEIKLSDILRRCNRSETPWEILQLDNLFDFENMRSYKNKIPPMDEILSELNETISNTQLVSDTARTAINDIFNSGVQEIEFFKYSMEVAKPLIKNNLSLTTFAASVTTAADAQVTSSPTGVAVADKLRSIATALSNLQNTVVSSQSLTVELTTKSQKLMTDNMNTMNKANKIDLLRGQFRSFLEGEGSLLANKAGQDSLNHILTWMDLYLDDTVTKLRTEVGDCQPIRNVYDTVVSNICTEAVGPVNALWLSLGVISLFSLITLILCVRLAKHFRRASCPEDLYTEESTSNYGVPMRLFDKFPKLRLTPWRKSSPPVETEDGRWNKN